MTTPHGPHEGEVFVGVHADTSPYAREADRGIRAESQKVEETTLKDVGHEFGKTVSKGMGDELEKSGDDLVHRVEKGLTGKRVRWKVRTVVDKDNNVVRTVVEETFQDIEKAFDKANQPGGLFDKVGKGAADAVGNAFNVSGSSPLITVLVPAIGALVALILAAAQAVSGLVAALGTLPAAIAGIGLQVGVLYLAFKGLTTAIGGAFAAKNAKELEAALKGLAPAAQAFVRELLPLRQLFEQMQFIVQQNFFKALGDVIPRLQKALGFELTNALSATATALGGIFRQIALFFTSSDVQQFLKQLLPRTVLFIKEIGPSVVELLKGITDFSIAILPFLTFLGGKLSEVIFDVGGFLARTSRDPAFKKWLDQMATTLLNLKDFLDQAINLVFVLFDQLNKAGGADLIKSLADDLKTLAGFLSTPVGEKALEGIIDATKFLTESLVGLFIIVATVFAAVEAFGEWIKNTAIPAFIDFADVIGTALQDAVMAVGHWFERAADAVANWFVSLGEAVKRFLDNIGHGVVQRLSDALTALKELPGKITAFTVNFDKLLFRAGANLIQGLIDGILSKLGPLGKAMLAVGQIISDHVPHSPAKKGPLSGPGDPKISGKRTVDRFIEGMKLAAPNLSTASSNMVSNIVFGPGAVRVEFSGQLPTQEQAARTGSLVGSSLSQQLAARDTRLAVRTL